MHAGLKHIFICHIVCPVAVQNEFNYCLTVKIVLYLCSDVVSLSVENHVHSVQVSHFVQCFVCQSLH